MPPLAGQGNMGVQQRQREQQPDSDQGFQRRGTPTPRLADKTEREGQGAADPRQVGSGLVPGAVGECGPGGQ